MKWLFKLLLIVISFNLFAADPPPSPVTCEKGYSVYRYVDHATKNLVVACATSGTPRINHGPAVIYSPKGEVIRETTYVEGKENFVLKDSTSGPQGAVKTEEHEIVPVKKEQHKKK